MGMAVPTWVRFAIGLAILGVGVSLAFIFMPDSTTYMRVGASIACAACLAFVALMWRQIGRNQKKMLRKTPLWPGDELDRELYRLTTQYKALTEKFNPREGIRNLDEKTREALAAVASERERERAMKQLGRDMNVMGESGLYER